MRHPVITRIANRSWLLPLLIIFLLCERATLNAEQLDAEPANSGPQDSEHRNAENWVAQKLGAPLARDPIFVYNDWSAYDELSDNIPLTEQLAMKELGEVLRLRRFGV